MRILVFFDLPVARKSDRKQYAKFRKYLLNDGYDMIQYSVYCRICNGNDGMQKYLERLNRNLPPKGSVRVLTITDKQYARMKLLVGLPTPTEKKLNSTQLSLF
ncbi:CRISPR-associated endonuclease Cas2 [Thermoflavimicrobium daqui]|uniref:CRISPR-associated endoribonuclease Cas2 n=1 Tax=Thermoflavimicrobium daqui TaxID=2137476 RepID=A0A364K8V9_9BACL|nr:CRISPR-associated endonuclease Cas2 [Thermoflavimicrobium daqui]RAL26735.1 CRISPR-associated endonuclease Cas2 [Thermoflavimicrobium daqui]